MVPFKNLAEQVDHFRLEIEKVCGGARDDVEYKTSPENLVTLVRELSDELNQL